MFDALSNRLQDVFQSLKGETRLTESTVENALREIRLALLEADVNFKVVKAFVDRVRDRATDQAVLKSLTPSQQVIKIVRDELLALFGDAKGGLQETTARIREATGHLKGVKIAIMGCIVNGPGEMADADFGYVGGAPGKVNLYVGKTPVKFNIPQGEAVDRLIDLIREHGKWVDAGLETAAG